MITAVSVGLIFLLLLPYLKYVLLAIVFAYVLSPAQRRLERRMDPMSAAIALIVAVFLLLIVPVTYILAVAIQEGMELVSAVQDGDLTITGIEDRLGEAGYPIDIDGVYASYQDPIRTALEGVATSAIGIVGGGPELLIGLTISLFVLYALLIDSDRLLAWFRTTVPLDDAVQRELVAELDRLMWASVVSNVAIAALQAILIGIAVAIAGIPGAILIGVVTFLVALLPLIGVVAVWLPLSIYLVAVGRPLAAALMLVYGLAISTLDNYLRAALMGHSGGMNVAVVMVGIFGGIAVFGVVGLFVGPVVLGGAIVTLETVLRAEAKRDEPQSPTNDSQSTADESLSPANDSESTANEVQSTADEPQSAAEEPPE